MKKVIIENSVNVDVMIDKLVNEVMYLNCEYYCGNIKNYIVENGSGIYEFCFGSGGGLEKFIKNDEYVECLNDNDNFVLRGENFVKCVSFDEKNYSVFVNVVV